MVSLDENLALFVAYYQWLTDSAQFIQQIILCLNSLLINPMQFQEYLPKITVFGCNDYKHFNILVPLVLVQSSRLVIDTLLHLFIIRGQFIINRCIKVDRYSFLAEQNTNLVAKLSINFDKCELLSLFVLLRVLANSH